MIKWEINQKEKKMLHTSSLVPISAGGPCGRIRQSEFTFVEHGVDIEQNWALGTPHPTKKKKKNLIHFLACKSTQQRRGDEWLSAVRLSLPRASCGNVQVLLDLLSLSLSSHRHPSDPPHPPSLQLGPIWDYERLADKNYINRSQPIMS